MTSGHFAGSPEFPEHIPTTPRHRSELSDIREIMTLEDKVSEVIKQAGKLGMLDNRAMFHSTMHDGDRVVVASEVVDRVDGQPDYLRIVTNRHVRTEDVLDDGFIFASDSLIGLQEINKNISTGLGVIAVQNSSAVDTYDGEYPTPPLIAKNASFQHIVYNFENTPLVPYPLRATVYNLPEVIADKVRSAEHVSLALGMLTAATEDARYPFDS